MALTEMCEILSFLQENSIAEDNYSIILRDKNDIDHTIQNTYVMMIWT